MVCVEEGGIVPDTTPSVLVRGGLPGLPGVEGPCQWPPSSGQGRGCSLIHSLLPHPGILLPTELPLFTQLGGVGLQGSQIPFSPFPSENTSRNNEEIGRHHLIAPKEPAGLGARGPGAGGRHGWEPGLPGWDAPLRLGSRRCHPKTRLK